MKPLLCALLIALLLATPVAATVQYPEEYYTLGKLGDSFITTYNANYHGVVSENANFNWYDQVGNMGSAASFYELRRQTILIEKQNELLQEQNELLRKILPKQEVDTIHYEYCNALNTSQCWKNASEIPRYLP